MSLLDGSFPDDWSLQLCIFDYGKRILISANTARRGAVRRSVLSDEFLWLDSPVDDEALGREILELSIRVPALDVIPDDFDEKGPLKAMGFTSFRQQARNAKAAYVKLSNPPFVAFVNKGAKASGEFYIFGESVALNEPSAADLGSAVRGLLEQ